MRTFDEVKLSVDAAFSSNDAPALLQYAAELDEIGTTEARAMSAHAHGFAETFYNNYTQALEHYNRAHELCEETGNYAGVASVTSNIGIVYIRIGNHALALEHWNRAMALYKELDNRLGVANTTCNIGNIFSGAGDYAKALEHYRQALEIHTELDVRRFMAVDTTCIGEVYKNTGNYPLALEHYHRALALYEELGNRVGVANVIGNIGTVYVYTRNQPQALEYLNRALALYEELGVRAGKADILTCIGNVHASKDNYHKALEYYYSAKKLHEEIGAQGSLGLVIGNIITALVESGSIAEAEELLVEMDGLHLDDPGVAIIRIEAHASLQEHYGQLDDAMQSLRSALTVAQEHSLPRVQANIHSLLRDLCQKKNDFSGYIEHNTEYTRITEEINGRDTATKLAMQEAELSMAKERERERIERERIANEREREQAVLYSTLPKHIADRVIGGESVNDHINNASVLFVDIVGFTTLSSTLTSQEVSSLLDAVFGICDASCHTNSVTRIKTIGDSYLAFSD